MRLIRPVTAPPAVLRNATIAAEKAIFLETALKVLRTRLATSVARPDISRVIAPTHLLKGLDVVAEAAISLPAEDPRSATSAARLDILLVTAQRPAPAVVINVVEAMVAVTTVAMAAAKANVVRLVTRAVATAICHETAPRVRSAITAVKWAIFPGIAHLRPRASVPVTSANSQVTCRLSAPTKSSLVSIRRMIH